MKKVMLIASIVLLPLINGYSVERGGGRGGFEAPRGGSEGYEHRDYNAGEAGEAGLEHGRNEGAEAGYEAGQNQNQNPVYVAPQEPYQPYQPMYQGQPQ